MQNVAQPPDVTEGEALCLLDIAATKRIRAMLRTSGWRTVMNWLVELSKEAETADVGALLALVARIELDFNDTGEE